jgi:hypothetical protein
MDFKIRHSRVAVMLLALTLDAELVLGTVHTNNRPMPEGEQP